MEIQAACLHPPMDVHPEMVCKRTLCLCSSSQLSCPFMSNSKEEAVCASQPSLPIASPALFSIAAQDLYILSSFPDLFFCPPSPSIIHLSHTQASHSLHAVGLRDAPSPSAPPRPPALLPTDLLQKTGNLSQKYTRHDYVPLFSSSFPSLLSDGNRGQEKSIITLQIISNIYQGNSLVITTDCKP